MLSLLPQLFAFKLFAITLLRIVAGCYVLFIAWQTADRRAEISRARVPLLGHAPQWLVWLAAMIYAIVGGLLVIGAWTQIAAIVAAAGALKLAILSRRTHPWSPLSGHAYALLFVITLSLVFLGPGILAFDLPL